MYYKPSILSLGYTCSESSCFRCLPSQQVIGTVSFCIVTQKLYGKKNCKIGSNPSWVRVRMKKEGEYRKSRKAKSFGCKITPICLYWEIHGIFELLKMVSLVVTPFSDLLQHKSYSSVLFSCLIYLQFLTTSGLLDLIVFSSIWFLMFLFYGPVSDFRIFRES